MPATVAGLAGARGWGMGWGRGGSKLFSTSDLRTHPFRVPRSQFAGSLVMSVMPAGSFASITDEAFGLQGVDLGPTQPLLDDLVDFGLPAPLDALSLGAGGSLTSLAASLGIALAEADPLVNIAGTLEFGDMATLPPFASLAASLAFGSAALSVGLGPQPELFEPLDLGLGDPLTQLNDFLQFDARPTLSVVHSLTSMTLSVGAVVPGLGDGDLLADFELPGTLQDFMLPNMGLLSASKVFRSSRSVLSLNIPKNHDIPI